MSAPLLAVTADGELENENYWLACDVCALVGRDRHSACHLHNENYWLACNVCALVARPPFGLLQPLKRKNISSPAMSAPSLRDRHLACR
jgi:hypothetical protein